MMFLLYIEEAMKEFKDNIDTGIEIQKELEDTLNGINEILIEEIKMKINKNKTKVLVCRRNETGMHQN